MEKKTLYVSDLDGTLLNPSAQLNEGAAERINAMTGAGVMITYATARTVRSVAFILEKIDFTLPGACPVALMNGVLVRDMKAGQYLCKAVLKREKVRDILKAVTETDGEIEPFIYAVDEENTVNGDPLLTYYRRIANPAMEAFMAERVQRFAKPFIKMDSVEEIRGDVVYFAIIGPKGSVLAAAEKAEKIPGTRCTYYRDSYDPDTWYLEIFDESASKRHAVEFLRQYTGAEELICFGDNLNDLPMLETADVAVAVENAAETVKKAADVITADVVSFIEEREGKR